MDKRLILCVLLVTLSWGFMGSYALVNTEAPACNMTTVVENNVTHPTNMSSKPGSNMTTVVENNVTNPANMSSKPASNMTMVAENNGMNPLAANMSVSSNTTVITLETSISNAGCGSQHLCVAEPSKCDPSATGSCLFLAAKKQSGQNFTFELSGESKGYIAATLTDRTIHLTYVCAKSNGGVKFFGALLSIGNLTLSELYVNSVKGKIADKKIQCSFLATVPITRANLSVFTGEFNESNDTLGAPTAVIKTTVVDLENLNNTVTDENTPKTTTPASTSTVAGNNATTVAPPATVIPLLVGSIARQECRSTKLCAAQPSECDPAKGDSCYFLSAKQKSNQTYDFELSGQSVGYIAAGLSTVANQAGSHRAYICANNNNSTVRFFTGTVNNFELNVTESLNSSNQQGTVNGSKIQCTFTAVLPETKTRAAKFSMSVFTGDFNTSSGKLGKADFKILTNVVNLLDYNASITNTLANNNSASLVTLTQSFLPALLVTVCILAFTSM